MPAPSERFPRRLTVRAAALALGLLCAAPLARAASDDPAPSPDQAMAPHKSKRKAKAATDDAATSAKPALPTAQIETLRQALIGDDDEAATEAAATLGASETANAAEPLVEVLAEGAAPARLQAALDGLTKLGEAKALRDDSATFDAITLYAGHRTTEVRRRAIKALAALNDPRVVDTLMERLGDQVAEVRAAAAEALAARHETKAVKRMFALLALGDVGVAGPFAALATPDEIPKVAELAGTVDDSVVAGALGEYVKRNDVPDKLRVDVVRTIASLSGATAATALVDYVASVPAKDDRASKHEAQKLLDQRGVAQ